MKIIPAGDSSVLVVFGEAISLDSQRRVLALFHALQARCDARIRNLHPAYASLLVDFDPLAASHDEMAAAIEQSVDAPSTALDVDVAEVEVPVCYDPEFGPDLNDVAFHNNISAAEVVRLHSSATYFVGFLGFTAGFAYMGGLPDALHTPRLTTPRHLVAAGSVGIAGGQTGIYPANTPGGWRLIGRTPLRMFDPQAKSPTLLRPGDRVQFAAIDRQQFERLREGQG